jgi:Flp pilus assembly protein TadD
VSHSYLGNVLQTQGDLAGARQAYDESLAAIKRLAAPEVRDLGWQRDLSKAANALRLQPTADPTNALWQHDLGQGLRNLGNVLEAQGDLAGARQAYSESLTVTRRLTAADPSDLRWQSGLGASLRSLGGVLEAQGDLAGALQAIGESLALMRRLAAADPGDLGWQRDLRCES